jgi:RNA polymerase sigma-19 factor, ECF subfamily
MASEPAHPASRLATAAFNDHAVDLQRYLARRVGRTPDADDLAQEVFARLLRVRNADLVLNPLAYLLGIATHVVREFRQRKQRDHVLFDSEAAEDRCENPGYVPAHGTAEHLDLQRRLDLALARLSPTHRLVLLLVKRDGCSYPEAAKIAGLSVHTVEKYLVEARARMRIMLQDP